MNDSDNDIEILKPPAALRQKGYESGAAMCSAASTGSMNQSFVNPVPFTPDFTEWIDCHHFGWSDRQHPGGNRVAPIKFRYSPKLKRYEWVETGGVLFYPEYPAIEASTVHLKDSWAIGARPQTKTLPVLWVYTENPFASKPGKVLASISEKHPLSSGPMTVYKCADGAVRLLSGDKQASPYKLPRNPLYCWNVNPEQGFALTHRRVVVDLMESGLQMRRESGPVADMAKLLPHTGGREQLILHRVRTTAIGVPNPDRPVADDAERRAHGIYSARLIYEEAYPDSWEFS